MCGNSDLVGPAGRGQACGGLAVLFNLGAWGQW